MSSELIKTYLADDHALVRAGLRDALQNLPEIQIIGETGNGKELALALETTSPDLLVMDVNMPDFDPVKMVITFKAAHPSMKILVVSAHDDEAYVVGLLNAGVDGYHLKDQPLSDFIAAVRRVVEGGRWISDPLVSQLLNQHAKASPNQLRLTPRQRQLLAFLSLGYNNQKMALVMELSVKTIENHLTALYRAINVESRIEASNFAIRNPELLIEHEREKNNNRVDSEVNHSLSILLVDDNPRYRTQLGKLISRNCPDYSLFEVEDSAEAEKIAALVFPKLAFIDVVLHDEDGIRCASRVKAISPNTRVILISAYPDREFRRSGMKAGATAFLDKKDIDAATVRQVVEDALADKK